MVPRAGRDCNRNRIRTIPRRTLAGGLRVRPAARRLAREKGVDLAAVAAKLNLARPVSEEDVRRFLAEG